MNLTRKNLAAIFLIFIFAFSCVAQQTAPRKFEPIPEELANLVIGKREQILGELATLQGNEWVGKYRSFDSATVTTNFDWTPTKGFTIWQENCSRPGDVRVNYGSVNFNGNLLTLSPEQTEKGQHTYISPASLVPVKWGEQHLLIPSDELILFIYAVNSGSTEQIETFLVKTEDYYKSNDDLPIVPQEYKKYLGIKPITAKVSALGTSDSWYPPFTLNVGKAQGVVSGMSFYLTGVKDIQIRIVVDEVRENTSVAYVASAGRSGDYEQEIKPTVGWRFTSKLPKGYF